MQETIKVVKDGFIFFFTKSKAGWTPCTVKIGEAGNKIEIEAPVWDFTIELTLTRK